MPGAVSDTIAAVATGSGGAISVVRVSGSEALRAVGDIFVPVSGKPLATAKGYTVHYGNIIDQGQLVDEVLVTVFRAPRSYTGEDMAEISCHGSPYVRRRIMALLAARGVRPATAGEFTMRAFMAGKMDLSQAEAVADMIASEDRATHRLAVSQMRGGYSDEFRGLRGRLVELVSLLELELDFSEEDIEFADRGRLVELLDSIQVKIQSLTSSFAQNNALKEGVPVVIAGQPNTGKSTLLNALLKEDRAMVSDIAGTTRDVIEGVHVIGGMKFRFTDTAGLRETPDRLEKMGIERAKDAVNRARILLYLVSPDPDGRYDYANAARQISELPLTDETKVIMLLNKADKLPAAMLPDPEKMLDIIRRLPNKNNVKIESVLVISAKENTGIEELKGLLSASVDTAAIAGGETIVTNSRHHDALVRSGEAIGRAREGIAAGLPADLLSEEIRDAVYHLGTVTGEITNDEILGSIFSKFCIGK